MTAKSEEISIIESGLTVEGGVSCQGKLIVKGTIKGHLEVETLVIAEDGAVYAQTTAGRATIGGLFDGEINVTGQLDILATGTCRGSVACTRLLLEAGGVLDGEISCGGK